MLPVLEEVGGSTRPFGLHSWEIQGLKPYGVTGIKTG